MGIDGRFVYEARAFRLSDSGMELGACYPDPYSTHIERESLQSRLAGRHRACVLQTRSCEGSCGKVGRIEVVPLQNLKRCSEGAKYVAL